MAATENAQTITYAVTSGTLPSGLTLNSNGNITGTLSGSATTYNFTVTATDPQGQTASRNFSYAVTVLPIQIDYLVAAGGGGGGGSVDTNGYAGGGGAGGLLTATSVTVTPGTAYTITVGGGGTAGPNYFSPYGGQGSNSSISGSGFTTVKSYGGGGGGGGPSNGGDGGSGGGCSRYLSFGPGRGVYPGSAYISEARQGYDSGGSAGNPSSGGGAGGTNGSGLASSITGASVTYCSGGAPYRESTTAANLGNGGDGAMTNGTTGKAGGSGVIILRFLTPAGTPSTTGSPTITTDGSYKVYKFTQSGSITF